MKARNGAMYKQDHKYQVTRSLKFISMMKEENSNAQNVSTKISNQKKDTKATLRRLMK